MGPGSQGDKPKARDHLVLQSKEVNPQSGDIPTAASAPTLQGNRTGGKWKELSRSQDMESQRRAASWGHRIHPSPKVAIAEQAASGRIRCG